MDIAQEVTNNLQTFEALKQLAFNESNLNEKLKLLQYTSTWAVREHTGKFSDKEIEKALSKISKQYSFEQKEYCPNSFLHVMTECSDIGGHTRIVEKWMNASDDNEVHSLLLIKQKLTIPQWLISSTQERQGTLYQLPLTNTPIQKALELRDIASKYEYIVLHTHMDDIIPLLAFATEDFKRPIIFVNHGDHLFWLGISIIDMLYDASHDATNFTKHKRGNILNEIVPVPLEFNNSTQQDKQAALNSLGLQLDDSTKIILSMANSYKYHYLDDYTFIKMALNILKANPDTIFIVIGPDKDTEKPWKDAYNNSNKRLIAVGLKVREEVNLYKAISDLYIDSFPFNSYTAFLECASHHIPSLSLKTEFNSLDILIDTPNHCSTIDEIIQKSTQILQNSSKDQYDLSEKIISYHSIDKNWIHCKNRLIERTPDEHTLHWEFSHKNTIDTYDKMLYALTPGNTRKIPFEKTIHFKNNIRILSILYKYNKLVGLKILNYLFKILKYSYK